MSSFRKRDLLNLEPDELQELESISKSRTAPFAQVKRASILLRYSRNESINSIAKNEQTSRPTVGRCIDKALSEGVMTALFDLPRPGRPPLISDQDKAWVIDLACSRPSDLGYDVQRWTFSRLASYIRRNCIKQGHPSLQKISKSAVHKILREAEIDPNRTRYFFDPKDNDTVFRIARMLYLHRLNNQEICCFCGQFKP